MTNPRRVNLDDPETLGPIGTRHTLVVVLKARGGGRRVKVIPCRTAPDCYTRGSSDWRPGIAPVRARDYIEVPFYCFHEGSGEIEGGGPFDAEDGDAYSPIGEVLEWRFFLRADPGLLGSKKIR